ncbi:hypothetical protein D3C84_452240 [compost metagenome]
MGIAQSTVDGACGVLIFPYFNDWIVSGHAEVRNFRKLNEEVPEVFGPAHHAFNRHTCVDSALNGCIRYRADELGTFNKLWMKGLTDAYIRNHAQQQCRADHQGSRPGQDLACGVSIKHGLRYCDQLGIE